MAKKKWLAITLLLLLAGCETTQSWTQRFSFLVPQPESATHFDFNWRLSGAREVAPLQVFSTEQQLWLQFPHGQNIPAIFALDDQRQIPLRYKYSDPYVIVKGAWRHLIFRGAALQAEARYESPVKVALLANKADDDMDSPQLIAAQAPPNLSTELASEAFALAPSFSVSPADGTLRQAIKRWAQHDGWLFEDQHWEVDVDLPIASFALFSANFNESVVQLMRSTALGARPLQACLYSNKVLRVIPLAQSCDLTVSTVQRLQG